MRILSFRRFRFATFGLLAAGALALVTVGLVLNEPEAAAQVVTCRGKTATIVGTAGSNTINGTNGDDVISGLGGHDVINGLEGNDTICGDDGDDTISGGNGADVLDGGPNTQPPPGENQPNGDWILGDRGTDSLFGGTGTDILEGEIGADTLNGESGSDGLNGGPDLDTGPNADTLNGGEQDDVLWGSHGDDILNGDDGHDGIYGGHNADTVDGGDGSDYIRGNRGVDTLRGGNNDDALYPDIDGASMDGGAHDTEDLCVDGQGQPGCERFQEGRAPCPDRLTGATEFFPSKLGTYLPPRLEVVSDCTGDFHGRVATMPRVADDGDLKFTLNVDPQGDACDTTSGLDCFVIEFMPRDRGALTRPAMNDRLGIIGVRVRDHETDTDPGHVELHPVFSVRYLSESGDPVRLTGPQLAGSPLRLGAGAPAARGYHCWGTDGLPCTRWDE